MGKRLFRMMGVVAFGFSFQFLGCDSQEIGDILVGNVKTTAVDVSTVVVESLVDNAFGIQ